MGKPAETLKKILAIEATAQCVKALPVASLQFMQFMQNSSIYIPEKMSYTDRCCI